MTADVQVSVTTNQGNQTLLNIRLWDQARLTPWSLDMLGDGWKPTQVERR